jgi:hypothetical protein
MKYYTQEQEELLIEIDSLVSGARDWFGPVDSDTSLMIIGFRMGSHDPQEQARG